MSNPNLINVTNISAKTTGQSVGTSPTSIVSNSVDSFKSLKINSLRVANLDDFAAYNITASVYQGDNVLYSLAYNVSVPSTATLILVSRDSQLYLEEGQSLRLSGSQAQKFDAVCSYEEISREEYLLFTNENITGLNAAQGNLVPFPILENSLVNFSFNVPSTMISPTSQTFYWEIKNITNALPEYFAATSAAIPIPSNATTASFSIATQFVGDLSRGSTRWGVRVYKDVIGGPLVYESGSFTIELPTISAAFTKTIATENSSFEITATILNIGTRTSTIPIAIQNSGTATSDDFVGGWPTSANLSLGANTITYNLLVDGDNTETLSAALYNGSTLIVNVINSPVSLRSQLYNSALTFTNENIVGTTTAQGAQTFLIKENSTINFTFTLANSQTLPQTFYWKINHIADSFNDQFVSSSGSFTINSGATTGTFSVSTNFIGVSTRTPSYWTVQLLTGSVNGTVVYETSEFSTLVSILSASFDVTTIYESNTIALTINLANVGTKTLPIPVTIQNSGTATSADFANGWPTSASLNIGNTAVNYIVAADGNTEDNETLYAAIYYGEVLLLNVSNNPVTIIDTLPTNPTSFYVTAGNGTLELGSALTVGQTIPTGWFKLKDNDGSDITAHFTDINNDTLVNQNGVYYWSQYQASGYRNQANYDLIIPGNVINLAYNADPNAFIREPNYYGSLAPYYLPMEWDASFNFRKSLFAATAFRRKSLGESQTVWRVPMPNFGLPTTTIGPFHDHVDFYGELAPNSQIPAHTSPSTVWGSFLNISSMGWVSVVRAPDWKYPKFPNVSNPLDFLQNSYTDPVTNLKPQSPLRYIYYIGSPSIKHTPTQSWLSGGDGFSIGVAARVVHADGVLRRLLVGIDPAVVSANGSWHSSDYIRLRFEYDNPVSIFEMTMYTPLKTNELPNTNKATDEGWYKWKTQLVTGQFNRATNIVTQNGIQVATNSQLVAKGWGQTLDYNIPDISMPAGDGIGLTISNQSNGLAQFIPEANKTYVIGVGKDTDNMYYGKIWGPDVSSPNGYRLANP